MNDHAVFPAHPDWEVPAFTTRDLAPRQHRVCVLIPVINEGARIRAQLDRMRRAGIAGFTDIVIADGGSTDGSLDEVTLSVAGVRALLIKTGPGKLSAQLRMGLAWAHEQGYEGFVLVDGNNKDSIEIIPDFVCALDDGWDYVQGSRYMPGGCEENTPVSRKWAVKLLHAPVISVAAGFRYTDTTNGFRALSRRFLSDPDLAPFRDVFDTYNLHYYMSVEAPRRGYRVRELPVSRVYPPAGPTPSKIKGLRGNFQILGQVFRAAFGCYRRRPDANKKKP